MFRKIKPLTYILIGLSLSVILLALGWTRFWAPNIKEAESTVEANNATVLEANKYKQAVEKKNVTIAAFLAAEAAWAPHKDSHSPSMDVKSGGINVNVNPMKLQMDTKVFRNAMQTRVNNQVKAGGVEVVAAPWVNGVSDSDDPNGVLASYYNYPTLPFPAVVYDLGQVTVRGTYAQIATNVRSWRYMQKCIAVAHGLSLSGTANGKDRVLTGTYNVSIYVPIRYDGAFQQLPLNGGGTPLNAPAGAAPAPGAPAASGAPAMPPSMPGGGAPGIGGPPGMPSRAGSVPPTGVSGGGTGRR